MGQSAARRIPIADPDIGEDEAERVRDVVESGHLAEGDVVAAFEEEFANYCDAAHAVATTNGTTALHAAFEGVGIEPGDRVVTSPFSFVASANAIRFAGGVPKFGDVDSETYALTPESVERVHKETPGGIDAILAVHLYGLPADLGALADVADDIGVPLVTDAAQAHGAEYDGDRVGALGDVGCFSFYPTKNMTSGEGGMVVTDDPEIADAVSRFINHGRETDGYDHVELGHNFRMTDVCAAVGRTQFEKLSEYNHARRRNAARLDDLLADTALVTPTEPADRHHVYHQYTVRCHNRDEVVEALDGHGIDARVYYPTPIHQQPAFDGFEGSAPVAETVADQVLSLPVHPGLSPGDVDRIGRTLTNDVTIEHV